MSAVTQPTMLAQTPDVLDVTNLARRYARVLISRRLLRALAVGTTVAALTLLFVTAMVPFIGASAPSPRPASQQMWVVIALILGLSAGTALAIGLVVLYVRGLAALARGSRRAAAVVMLIVGAWLLVVAVVDLSVYLLPREQAPLQVFALAALAIQAALACGLMVGPWELRRADPLAASVFEEPRLGAGLKVEIGRLLDFADVRSLRQKKRIRAWLVLSLAVLVEGAAFHALLTWSAKLLDAASKPVREPLSLSPATATLLTLALAVLLLTFSATLIRLMLRWAKRLRIRARRMTLRPADEVVVADTRPPILFLRSFEKEHAPLEGAHAPWILRAFDPGAEYGTLEELIVLGLTYVGPVVAIADPSRPDVPEGAARWRLGDEWKRFVESQIALAGLIVVGVAETKGLRWEMEAIERTPGALEKTIFVFPPGMTRESAVAAHVWSVVGGPQSVTLGDGSRHLLGVGRLRSGKLAVLVASEISEPVYQTALRAWIVKQRDA